MKTLKHITAMLSLLLILNCSKEENTPTPPDDSGENELVASNGAPLDSFETYKGDIGFAINAREIAKRGYKPVKAMVTVEASSGNFSQSLDLDPDTQLAQIKLSKEDLTEEQINELTGQNSGTNGVAVKVDVMDENNNIIISQNSTETFISNPLPKVINPVGLLETSEVTNLVLPENTFYYLQSVDENGVPLSSAMTHNTEANQDNVMITSSSPSFSGNDPSSNFSFYPVPGEENTFFIKLRSTGGFLSMGSLTQFVENVIYTHNGLSLSIVTDVSQIQNNNNTKFRLAKIDDGIYELQTFNGTPLRVAPGIGLTRDLQVMPFPNIGTPPIASSPIQWRLLNTSITWTVQNIGTTFMEPVLGPATISETFNSTLTNCGQGSLTQTVSNEGSVQTSLTHGMEESFSFSSTNSISIGASFSAEFQANFFGVGATYTASVSSDYTHSQSVTETSATWEIGTETVTQSNAVGRTVTVLPGTASLVYDVYQQYNDIKINFVQKFRVTGFDETANTALNGEQIRSQFQFSKFEGVITDVEDNSVVVTLRGVRNVGRFIRAESDVQDVPANCN